MKELSKQLKAIANERRLKILVLLTRGKAWTVGNIAEALKLSFRSTSRHLQVLKYAGLIADEQSGPFVYYRLDRHHPIFRCIAHLLN